MNIVEGIARVARTFPERPALIGGKEEITYRQLMLTVSALASRLADAGVQQGDRVELQVLGSRPMIVATLAIAYLGAVSVALPSGSRRGSDEALARACGVTHILHNLPPQEAAQLGAWCPVISFV